MIAGPGKRQILLEAGDNKGNYRYRGVVNRTWKLTQYRHGPIRQTEMYKLDKDPNELRNLARRPRYDDVRHRLVQRLRTLQHCRGRDCR